MLNGSLAMQHVCDLLKISFSKPLASYRQQFRQLSQYIVREAIKVLRATACLAIFLALKLIQVSLIY